MDETRERSDEHLVSIKEALDVLHMHKATLYRTAFFRQRFVRHGKRRTLIRWGDIKLYNRLGGSC